MFPQFPFKKRLVVSSSKSTELSSDLRIPNLPLRYNWIKTNKLAIGPMPRFHTHWLQLENDGFRNRFSCCYPHEHLFTPIPSHWKSLEISLPDHRAQEPLQTDQLIRALHHLKEMYVAHPEPLYLHCFAGQERSSLLAIGLICIIDNKDLFESLSFVRQCHDLARPIYSHLDLLEKVLKERNL